LVTADPLLKMAKTLDAAAKFTGDDDPGNEMS